VGRTPYSCPSSGRSTIQPDLVQLQKAYYTTDSLDTVIADGKTAMKAISCK
jgi:hypothetical protein